MSRWIEIHSKQGFIEVQFITLEVSQYTEPDLKLVCELDSFNNSMVEPWIKGGELPKV